MKKHGILNSEIASVLAKLGHKDTVVIADCGLPIPDQVKRIDLALTKGIPSFQAVLEAVAADMEVEKMTIANEISLHNAELEAKVKNSYNTIAINYVSHDELKEMCQTAKAVIRTGEVTPYANVILHAGVIF
ncbi:D-ribose pyranase [Bacillus tianshenii]|nr:D-ribose pyranase [Bacillus tianshenii]